MLYTIDLDENNYILSVYHDMYDNVELDLSQLDMDHISAYQYIDNTPVLDQAKYDAMIAEEEEIAKEKEIVELQHNLDSTDYIIARTFEEVMALNNPLTFVSDFIKILAQFKSQYADTLANRKTWRARIEELSK